MGITQKRLVQLFVFVLLIAGLIYRLWWLVVSCVAVIWLLRYFYRWASRVGYTTFVPTTPPAEQWPGEGLSPTTKIPFRGTGSFLLGDLERRLILTPGECWQLPIGEIALMLEAAPGHFAYQFIDLKRVEQLRFGEIWFGNGSETAIEVVFQTDWIQRDSTIDLSWMADQEALALKGRRTVVLSFEEADAAHQLWDQLSKRLG